MKKVAYLIFLVLILLGITGNSWATNPYLITSEGRFSKLDLVNKVVSTLSDTGTVSASKSYLLLDTYGGAASQDLVTITGGVDGRILILGITNASHKITVKNNSGNILCGGIDLLLDTVDKYIILVYDDTQNKWVIAGGVGGSGVKTTGTLAAAGDATNFPAASTGDIYQVSSAGWLGGGVGVGLYVNAGDLLFCTADTVAGTKAEVYASPGQYWNIQRAMISMPDGYRYVEAASNTSAPTGLTNGYYWLNDALILVDNGIAKHATLTPITYITTGNIAALDCYNGLINNSGQTNDTAMTLPTAAKGMSLMVVFSTAVAKYYRILPATGDGIYYEGVTAGTGSAHYVGVAATVVGQVMQFVSFYNSATSSYSWVVMPNFSGLVTP